MALFDALSRAYTAPVFDNADMRRVLRDFADERLIVEPVNLLEFVLGIGTLEEVVEQFTWVQLGRHKKPVLLANVLGFWNPLLGLLGHLGAEGYLYNGPDYLVADRIEDVVPKLRAAIAAVSEVELHGEAAKAVAEGF